MILQRLKLSFSMKPLWAVCLLVLVALILYIRVLGFEYVWDDTSIFFIAIEVLQNGNLTLSGLAQPMISQGGKYFRPLVMLTYYWEVSMAGFNPALSHGTNLALFIINALLVFSICQNLAEKNERKNPVRLAFFASLLYIIHPAMTEAAAWISVRFDLLATFFILSATSVYLGSARRRLKVALVSLLTFLALLCKETGAMLPAALLCIWFSLNSNSRESSKTLYLRALREHAGFISGFLMVFVAYIALRFYITQNVSFESIVGSENLYDRLFGILETFKFYLHQSFWPFFTISGVHPLAQISPWSLVDILGNALALLIAAFLGIQAFHKRSGPAWLFLAGFTYLILVLRILPIAIGDNIGHERFLTTPLAFWVMAMVLIRYDIILSSQRVTKLFSSMSFLSAQRVSWILAAVWILAASFTTIVNIPFWKNELALWGRNYSLFPDDRVSRHNYIYSAFSAKRYDLAEQALDKIVSDGHGFEIVEQIIYANILVIKNDPESLDYFEGIINHIPEFHTHEMPDSQENLEKLISGEKTVTIALAYHGYSAAVFIFRAAPEQALALNDTALWYAKPMGNKFVSDLEYRNVAYLYAMGEFEKGDVLRRKIESDVGVELTRKATESLLTAYCWNTSVAEHCKELRKRGLLAPVSSPTGAEVYPHT